MSDTFAVFERLYNHRLQSRIANTTIVIIEFHQGLGQSSGVVGGAGRATDSS
jgi:hypothetical protein